MQGSSDQLQIELESFPDEVRPMQAASAEAPQPAKVMDLMEALRQSVEQAKKQRGGREKPAAEAKKRRKAS